MPPNNPQPAAATDRVIRVFISSTFRDMMRERDLLVKEVFPELRRKCAKRFVTFTEVDLRWGITEAQANEGQVLPLCLAEIQRSRPYFIGLLGERYGWIPDTIRPEVIEREPWLKEHVQGRTSVTELEILHGVLNDPKMAGHAFFYFRDPAYVNFIPEANREDFTAENAKDAEKLRNLKDTIRRAGLPVRDGYRNPKVLSRTIRRDLSRLIDRLYPETQVPDLLTQERMAHEAHAKNKLFACINRPAHLAVLNDFAELAEHGGKGLVVTGESGGGKTALLAAWARDWAGDNPDDFLFQHYFGATPESTSPEGFLRRLFGELKQRFGFADPIPNIPGELRIALPFWLMRIPSDVQVVFVLDGLNQVQGDESDRHLRFLPRHFQPHVTVLASALPGPALDALRERGWAEHDLPRASEIEVDAMVGEYLKIHARALEPALRQQLVTAPGAKNPLFLRTVLEELRQFGSFEKLAGRVRHYLEAGNPKELFLRVIRRWQEDFDGKTPQVPSLAPAGGEGRDEGAANLTRHALSHLWAARQGLSESEWLDLLGWNPQLTDSALRTPHSEFATPFPRAFWTPLFLALEPHLSQRGGLFAFGHDFLRQAVETAFVPSDDLKKAAHLAVADYFERHPQQREMSPHKAAEWPHQLHAAESWERLEACLTDIPLFLALCNDKTQWELTGYWHPLRRLGRDMGACYGRACERWLAVAANAGDHYVPAQLGAFLLENGLYPTAEPLLRWALEASKRVLGAEHPDTLASVNNLAGLLERKGDYAGAEPLYRRALEVRERVLGAEHPDTLLSVNNLASLLSSKVDYAGAEHLLRPALEASERVLGVEHPDTLVIVNSLGQLLLMKGDCAGAEPLYQRALEASERVLGADHPHTLLSVNNLATLLESEGDYAGAEPLYRRALEALEGVLGAEHPDTLLSVNNLAGLLERKGDHAEAEPLYRRALEARERVLGTEHPDTLLSVNNLAGLLERKGDHAEAEPLYRRALEARERVLGAEHPDTLLSMSNLAELLSRKGDYAGAEPLYRRALEARERVLGAEHPDTLASVSNLAVSLARKGDYAGAEPLFRRVLEASERVLGAEHPSTLLSVNNLAGLLSRRGDYAGAEPLYRRALEVRERVLGAEHPDTLASVSNLAVSLARKGDYARAEPLYRRALEASERVLGAEHPDTFDSLRSLADLLEKLGRREECEQLRKQFADRVLHASTAVAPLIRRQLALHLFQKGDYPRAEQLLSQLLQEKFEVPGTCCHLARIALMTDQFDDGRRHVARAWQERAQAAPYVVARILWLQFALEMMEQGDSALRTPHSAFILGQLKTALQNDDAFAEWAMEPVLAHLKERMRNAECGMRNWELLGTLVAALNDRAKLPDLDRFPEWRNQAPAPL